MNGIDTLKQAAQALRDTKPELAAALEAMAMQPPAAYIEHHKGGDNLVWDDPGGKKSALYAAPIATPEHDAKVRDAALEEAAKKCDDHAEKSYMSGAKTCARRIRSLKSTGAAE